MKAKIGVVAAIAGRAKVFGRKTVGAVLPTIVDKLGDAKVCVGWGVRVRWLLTYRHTLQYECLCCPTVLIFPCEVVFSAIFTSPLLCVTDKGAVLWDLDGSGRENDPKLHQLTGTLQSVWFYMDLLHECVCGHAYIHSTLYMYSTVTTVCICMYVFGTSMYVCIYMCVCTNTLSSASGLELCMSHTEWLCVVWCSSMYTLYRLWSMRLVRRTQRCRASPWSGLGRQWRSLDCCECRSIASPRGCVNLHSVSHYHGNRLVELLGSYKFVNNLFFQSNYVCRM